MKIIDTKLPDLKIVEPRVFEDHRGYFFESYNEARYKEAGLDYDFVQDNESRSVYGVIRGLHYQLAPHAQTKLIRVVEGEILDVAVDIRFHSPTYGQWFSIRLNADEKKQLLVPRGFAHGFAVLSRHATIQYKCDNLYHPESDRGILYNDPKLNIDWGIKAVDAIISNRDKVHPSFEKAEKNITYSQKSS